MDKLRSHILNQDRQSNHRLQALTLPAVLHHQVQAVATMVQLHINQINLVIITNQLTIHSPHIIHRQLQIHILAEAVQEVVIKLHTLLQLQQLPLQLLQNPYNLLIMEDQALQSL